jgi:hypothetical protein
MENNNVKLSETLTKQFKDETEKLRAELSNKLTREVTQVQKDMDKLRSDTTIELLSVSNGLEDVCKKLDAKLTGHIKDSRQCMSRVNEELNAKTKVLEANLNRVVENTGSELQSIRQEFMQAKQQINADISDKISVCKSQILAEKQEYQEKFLKVNQEIDKLQEKLMVSQSGNKTINNHSDNCPVTALNNSSQERAAPADRVSGQKDNQSNVDLNRMTESVCRCSNNGLDEVNSVRVSDHVNHGLLENCSLLNELTLPIYCDSSSQIVGNFLKDLELYFDLKGVPANLKLPLAARAVHDPFTKAWISAEYNKLGSYENFRTQITQLLWNDQKQSNVRCKIFQDKYNKKKRRSK